MSSSDSSDSENELDTCGLCGDTYNVRVEEERGNITNLCNYHFGHRFGGYDTESEDEELVVYDESCRKETFAAQDWRQSELEDLLLMFEAPKYPGLITVTEDEWVKEDGVWYMTYKGKTGADCLRDLLEAKVLDYDTKRLICDFLTCNKVQKDRGLDLILFTEITLFRAALAIENIERDRHRGFQGLYLGFYHGVASYCTRCGDFKDHQRYNFILHGVCMDCGYAGLLHDYRDEIFNNMPNTAPRITRLIFPRTLAFSFIMVCENGRIVREPINRGVTRTPRDFTVEWPALEHPEWFARDVSLVLPELVVE